MKRLRIVLLGKEGAGKSSSGNTLLGIHPFHTSPGSERVTQASSMGISSVDQQMIEVIDTPGWSDSPQFKTEMKPNIIKFINTCEPHVFLLLLPIGRFTTEEISTAMNILKEFGDEVHKYMIVLFTKGDELEDKPIEEYLKEGDPNLNQLIQSCGKRYHVFNVFFNDLVEKNEEKRYTKAMFEKSKREQTLEADHSGPEKKKSPPTENEERHDGQKSSCDAEGKEKEKGETLGDSKELEKLMQNMVEQTQDCDGSVQRERPVEQ